MANKASASTSPIGMIVPLYSYPGPSWNALIQAKEAHPSVPIVAIINPDSGPGPSVNPNYVTGVKDLRAAGIVVLGYVYTSYAARNINSVKADMNTYKAWYSINGFFFDEMSNVQGNEGYYSSLSTYAKSIGFSFTVGNPGARVPASYVGTVSTMIVYEKSGAPALSVLSADSMGMSSSNFAFMSYSTALPSAQYLGAASSFVSYLYTTDKSMPNPYSSLASYVMSLAAAAASTPSQSTSQSSSQSAPVTVQSINSKGAPISGLWTVVKLDGHTVASGYTPLTFSGTTGDKYTVTVSNYGSYIFNHWDDGTTSPTRTITVSHATTVTAYYGAPQPDIINVQSITASGAPIQGLWTSVQLNGHVIASGYTPFTLTGTAGDTYTVTAYSYGSYSFSHWDGWSTDPSRTITLSQSQWLTEIYSVQ